MSDYHTFPEPVSCDSASPRDKPEPEPTPLCDHPDCGNVLDDGSTSVGGLGWYCSMECANKAEAEFAERMMRKGFQPSGLTRVSGE